MSSIRIAQTLNEASSVVNCWLQRLGVALIVAMAAFQPSVAGYGMYVWSDGFDATVPGCDEVKLEAWDEISDPECYTHTWDTPAKRQWLWDTANRPGREIERLFIADIKGRLEPAYLAGNCSDPEVQLIRQMLKDGHCKVPGVKLHALLSTNDADVSEQDHVPYIVWYNDTCAGGADARFDGVAVNNEHYSAIKCTGPAEQVYLDDLQAIADAADLQVNGTLETHYSMGWHWGQCGGVDTDILWDSKLQPATYHMIDIFDSVDVQIAHVGIGTASSRAQIAGYAHAVSEGKTFYTLSYSNKAGPADCTTTHFPYFCASTWSNPRRTDDYMMQDIFDEYPANGVPAARPGIHYFRGVYSTGGHPDWPSYYSGSVDFCLPALHGLLEIAKPLNGDDIISWPGQTNATMYELARFDRPDLTRPCRRIAMTQDTSATDAERPLPGESFSYLVRVASPEPQSWGKNAAGNERQITCQ